MIKLERVLFSTDFSEPAERAGEYACALAERFGAELHVLHVVETHLVGTPQFGMGLAIADRVKRSQPEVERALGEMFQEQRNAGQKVVCGTSEGAAYLEIIEYAKRHDVDLIVMGTHGRSGLEQILIGSVAERVVRMAGCPVLTVRPDGRQFVMP